MSVTVKDIPSSVAPAGEESNYKEIWGYYLWGFNADDIALTMQSLGRNVDRDYVRHAVSSMKDKLGGETYAGLAEAEIRQYLAMNVQSQQELMDMFIQARNDYYLLQQGKIKTEDGRKVMPVGVKDLLALLQAIEKFGQSRVAVLAKLASAGSSVPNGHSAGQLTAGDDESWVAALVRTPDDDVIDAKVLVQCVT